MQIAVELAPNTKYTLSVLENENVRDGFGLPLRSINYTFSTGSLLVTLTPLIPSAEPNSVLAYATGEFPIFETFASDMVYFYRDFNAWPCQGEAAHVDVANIRKGDVPNLIASLANYKSSFINTTKLALSPKENGLQRLAIDVEPLFGDSGLFLEEVGSLLLVRSLSLAGLVSLLGRRALQVVECHFHEPCGHYDP